LPGRLISAELYDANEKKPAGRREGTLKLGALGPPGRGSGVLGFALIALGAAVGMGVVFLGLACRRQANA
jgi:hypothetical protein